MEFHCEKDAVRRAVQLVSPFGGSRIYQIFNYIKVTADKNSQTVTLETSNINSHISLTIPAAVENSGTACVNLKTLGEFLGKAQGGDEIIVRGEKGGVSILYGCHRAALKTASPDDFPPLRHNPSTGCALIAPYDLYHAVTCVSHSTSTTPEDGVFYSIHALFSGPDAVFTASDRFRAASCTVPLKDTCPQEFSVLISSSEAQKIASLMKTIASASRDNDADPVVRIWPVPGNEPREILLSTDCGPITLSCLLTNAVYPDVRGILRNAYIEASFSISLDTAQLAETLNIASLFAPENKMTRITLTSPSTLEIYVSSEKGDYQQNIPCSSNGGEPPIQALINIQYLLQAISPITSAKGEEVTISVRPPSNPTHTILTPIVITSESLPEYIASLMPIFTP